MQAARPFDFAQGRLCRYSKQKPRRTLPAGL